MKRISLFLMVMCLVLVMVAPAAASDCPARPRRPIAACAPAPFLPQLFGFIPFDFTTHFTQSPGVECDPTRDIRLDAVTYGNKTRFDIMLVTSAHVEQEPYDDLGPGAFLCRCVVGTGHGINSDSDPLLPPTPLVPCYDPNIDTALGAAHGNLDLGSINYNCEVIVGDGKCDLNGPAIFTLSFPAPTERFLIYERGMDSDIHIEALDKDGVPIANAEIPRYDLDLGDPKLLKYAGFNIDTWTGVFSPGPQPVGSIGLKLAGGMLSDTIRITVYPKLDFGADLKILALAPEQPVKKVNLVPCPINYPDAASVPPGGGFVIFNNPNGTNHNLVVNGALEKVEPNTEYDLYLFVDDQGTNIGTVKTNPQGNATFQMKKLLDAGVHYLGFDVTKKGSSSDVYETPGIHEKKGTVLAFSVK